ncbi:MAG: sigma-70 family RNA polymerase sigma factor [Sciscionella sp.]|nr:sigma-70 family RNA polymerase sigma factor [Sciscionella sp.]
MVLASDFEAARSQLTALAFRLLGSIHDAEDAVQNTWIKASIASADDLRNPAAWLTTVLTRVCLDQLRMRRRRREEPLFADMIAAESLAADENYLQREKVSRALMVVLDVLTPAQRIAYVLHDLFDVPFREVARTLGTSQDNAKKHASRARRRIEQTEPVPAVERVDTAVVDAFLTAASGGDIDRMLAMMTDGCTRTADADLVPGGTPTVVVGAASVAEETRLFVDRIRAAVPMVVDGRPAYVIAPGGHLLAVVDIATSNGRVARINISRASASTALVMPSPTC